MEYSTHEIGNGLEKWKSSWPTPLFLFIKSKVYLTLCFVLVLVKKFMEINVASLLLGTTPFVIGLLLKFLLDLRIAPWIIKGLNIFPPRSIFRDNPPKIKGEWDVYWESDSKNFSDNKDRHKTAVVYQFGTYCYAEYAAKDQRYCLFGKIEHSYITGTWYNKNDEYGYRGAFQLKILNSKKLEGRWLGYSIADNKINTNLYTWTKNPN